MAAAGGQGRRVTLALDSVHGASGQRLVKALAPGGTYVQLGFLGGGKEQLPLDARDLFGRQLTMKAFRGSYQLGLRSEDEQRGLFDWFVELFNSGELQPPPLGLEPVEWVAADGEGAGKDVVQAVVRAQEARLGQRKQILLFKH
ncbi:putative mitochondrial enoyl protein [Neofusicoccum parvum UCRNP2]|uniref:Putative mitochondrial enoyl protein n=1 Tax=Botryosphaeria parva (strain UCR-NP2) TaxID=1287680 RepID=R1GEZ3_BOTPV|nr:putative mitochondrial enoyl protein [Neofusicoccum parvum UCRNP2]